MNQSTASFDSSAHREHIAARIQAVAAPEYPHFDLHMPSAPDREAAEARIAGQFARQYGAQIQHFLPYLVSVSVAGEIGAVAGLRPATDEALFLEQYLDSPVERAISRVHRIPVDRDQVVEIGNLASVAPGAASLLFGILPTLLDLAGLRWVACTATPQVIAMLHKLGFTTSAICAADPEVLGDGLGDWGSYYDCKPQVIVGDVREALPQTERNDALRSLLRQRREPIKRAALALRMAG